MDGTLGIVGCGRMGEALLSRLLESGAYVAADVVVADASAERIAEVTRAYDVAGDSGDGANVAALAADTVLLAVKPQVLSGVLEADGGAVRDDALVVSIAAGFTTQRLDALLPGSPAIVRVMPNTPALIGEGASVVAPGPRATDEHVDRVTALMAPLGLVRTLPESQIDAVTAVSGSGPAYVFLLAEALAEAGVLQGLARADAVALANQTVAGAGALLVADRGSATELREQVTSPGGTTAAALRELEQGGMRAAVLDAVAAAVRRAHELS